MIDFDYAAPETWYSRILSLQMKAQPHKVGGIVYVPLQRDETPEWIVCCKDCGHSRVETHTGDAVLVCWHRKTYGIVVPLDHFCGYCKRREACQNPAIRGDSVGQRAYAELPGGSEGEGAPAGARGK